MRALALSSLLLVAGCDVLDPMMVQDKEKPYRESDFASVRAAIDIAGSDRVVGCVTLRDV